MGLFAPDDVVNNDSEQSSTSGKADNAIQKNTTKETSILVTNSAAELKKQSLTLSTASIKNLSLEELALLKVLTGKQENEIREALQLLKIFSRRLDPAITKQIQAQSITTTEKDNNPKLSMDWEKDVNQS